MAPRPDAPLGNFFSSLASRFSAADGATIYNTAERSVAEFIETSGITDSKQLFQTLILAAATGLNGAKKLTFAQKELVNHIFGRIYRGSLGDVYAMLRTEIGESTYAQLQSFCRSGSDRAGIPLLKFILCFAYIDGALDPQIARRLDAIFGMALVVHFMNDNPPENLPQEQPQEQTAEDWQAQDEEEYQQELERWKQHCSDIAAKRREEVLQRIKLAEQRIKDEVKQEHENTCAACRSRIDDLKARITEAENTKAKLGLFKVAEKKAQQQIVDDSLAAIAKEEQQLLKAKGNLDSLLACAADTARKDRTVFEQEAAALHPMPEMSRAFLERFGNRFYRDAIVDQLKDGRLYTLEDLMGVPVLKDLSEEKIQAYLKTLVIDSVVERIHRGNRYWFRYI